MSEHAGGAGSPVPADIIPRLTRVAAEIAASHEESAPASIATVATTRAKALEVLTSGSGIPASHDAPAYTVVMTGRFVSYRGGGPPGSRVKLPRIGRCLVAVIDASTLLFTDLGLHDQDDTGLLSQLGPVATLIR